MKIKRKGKILIAYRDERDTGERFDNRIKVGDILGRISIKTEKFFGNTVCLELLTQHLEQYKPTTDPYDIYLMISLAQESGRMSRDLEYDTAWAEGQRLLADFEKSGFNKEDTGLYEAIQNFLKQPSKRDLALKQIALQEKIQKAGINLVTCGNCGAVLFHEMGEEKIDCFCGQSMNVSDCPDLWYKGCEDNSI